MTYAAVMGLTVFTAFFLLLGQHGLVLDYPLAAFKDFPLALGSADLLGRGPDVSGRPITANCLVARATLVVFGDPDGLRLLALCGDDVFVFPQDFGGDFCLGLLLCHECLSFTS